MTNPHADITSESFADSVHLYKVEFTEYLQQEHVTPKGTEITELSCKDASVMVVFPSTDQPTENSMRVFISENLKRPYRNPNLVDIAITNIEQIYSGHLSVYYEAQEAICIRKIPEQY